MDNSEMPTKKRSLSLGDVIAPFVFIVAIAGAVVMWRAFAGAPFWLAAILGFPSGCIAVLGGVWLLARSK